ncbi:hypothetical protein [Streptomyces sp. NPDC050145]|uniref:hypothetical protein n=1 Tax=Streptomyces sp. NPDC050145 TaxID=3365602 RepID=UPI003790A643
MTPEAAQPRHTAGQRVRRAHLSEAANGYDEFAPVGWIKRSGASVGDVLRAWHDGRLATVPAGKAWDVVQLPVEAGSEALRQLKSTDAQLGPILSTPDGFLVLVAVGTAADWNLPSVTVHGDGSTLRIPHPVMSGPYEHDGRAWATVPPRDDRDVLTDADALYGAYVSAAALLGIEGALG